MSAISAAATAAREAARVQGRFGVQVRGEPEVDTLFEASAPVAMDADDAMGWWFEEGSYSITTAAVDLVGGCSDDWDGWGPIGPDTDEYIREEAEESYAAAAAMLAATERFDHPVSHGTGRTLDLPVGSVYRIPLMSTSGDDETVEHFARSGSEDGVGAVWDFPEGAVGFRLWCTSTEDEYVITGDYRVTDRYVDEHGVTHTVFVPVEPQ